ncbi:MAG TPA: hypothetical protein VN903_06460, partial [Polyangia bacterium]|nr:hypothetical protein [Polyangia bacterium]
MGLLDFLRGNMRPPDPALEAYLEEVVAAADPQQLNIISASVPTQYESGRAILASPPAAQAATLVAAWGQL